MAHTLVDFHVHAETNPGQRIYVAGDCWALGDYRKENAVELVTTPKEFPMWRTPRSVLLPSDKPVSYRYMIFTGDRFESWEPLPTRSRRFTPFGNAMKIDDQYGIYSGTENTEEYDTLSGNSHSTASPPTQRAYPKLSISEENQPANAKSTEQSTLNASMQSSIQSDQQATGNTKDLANAPPPRIIIVSFHLPVFLHQNKETGEWIATWNKDSVTARSERRSIADSYETMWIGAVTQRNCPDYVNSNDSSKWEIDDVAKEGMTKALAKLNCFPLFLDPTLYNLHYNNYCKNRLWYLFHNILRVDRSADEIHSIKKEYEAYHKGNRFFADAVIPMLNITKNTNDIVWVHDYHLLLLPNMIREGSIAKAKETGIPVALSIPVIIYFLHVPFPTSEIFRTLSVRNELLEGLLGASVIGFHTFDHARHFLNCCKRFIGATYQSKRGGNLMLEYAGKSVVIAISHLGIDQEAFENILCDDKFCTFASKMRTDILTKLNGVKVPAILSNAANNSAGTSEKKTSQDQSSSTSSSPKENPINLIGQRGSPGLLSFGRKRSNQSDDATGYPGPITTSGDHASKTVIVGLAALERLKGIPLQLLAFEKLLHDVPKLSRKIRFVQWVTLSGSQSKDEKISQQEVRELVARINSAFGLVVELREFTKESPPTLEERVALWCLGDIFIHTPVSEGLNLLPIEYLFCHRKPSAGVVIISEFAACSRVLNGAFRVNCYDIAAVAKQIDEVIRLPVEKREVRRARDMSFILEKSGLSWSHDIINEALNIRTIRTENFVSIEDTVSSELQHIVNENFVELDMARVADAYSNSKRRLILFDFVGTLLERERDNLAMKRDFFGVTRRKISPATIRTLKALCSDPKNFVFVVSQSSLENISESFNDIISDPNSRIGLVAYNGLCVRWGGLQSERAATSATTDSNPQKELQLLFAPSALGVPDVLSSQVLSSTISSSSSSSTSTSDSKKEQQLIGWEMMMDSLMGDEWRQVMLTAKIPAILEDYTWHTGGSQWYMSNMSTVWEFRHADPEWGGIQATRLASELNEALSALNYDIRVARKRGSVQLLPKGADKRTAVNYIMRNLFPTNTQGNGSSSQPDFCLCIGDEAEDDLMFTEIMQYIGSGPEAHLYRPFYHQAADAQVTNVQDDHLREIFTCSVGRKPSKALFYVNSTGDVNTLLEKLAFP